MTTEQTTLEPGGEGRELINVREALKVLSEFCDGTQPFVGERFKKQLRNAIRAIPRVSAASTAPVVDSDLIGRQDAMRVAHDHDRLHSSGYRCYEGEVIARKIAALPARAPRVATAAQIVSQAITESGFGDSPPPVRSWKDGKRSLPAAASPAAPAEKCIHCDLSFLPSGPDSWCKCQCHKRAVTPPAAPQEDAETILKRAEATFDFPIGPRLERTDRSTGNKASHCC